MKVLSFGEILWDIYPDRKFIGGAPFNFAAHLAKYGDPVYMLSCLGQDDLGDDALSHLQQLGILTDFVCRVSDKQTGQCLVTLDENAVPTYDLKQDVAYDYIDCSGVAGDFDVLYFGTLALRSQYNIDSLAALLQKHTFKEVFVDVNIRAPFYSHRSVTWCLSNATILKISDEELPTIAGLLGVDTTNYRTFTRLLKKNYPNLNTIIVTLGGKGAYCYDCRQDREYQCPSQKVTVASTVGAGDSFSAAFLSRFFQGRPIPFCLEYATKIAGFVVSRYEAVPAYNVADFL